MKKLFIALIVLLSASGLFAEVVLYQKQHKNFDSIDVVALVKSADDWYYISIVIAEDVDAIEKYVIYDTSLERIQDLILKKKKHTKKE